jgi:hypothetical protein
MKIGCPHPIHELSVRHMKHTAWIFLFVLACSLAGTLPAEANVPRQSDSEFELQAQQIRREQLRRLQPQVLIPNTISKGFGKYPWRRNIVTTVFWVGEKPTPNNPTPNCKSSWDQNWHASFGGYDNPDPATRRNYIPIKFTPRQNPFYVALPFNDVTRGTTKPESRRAIPWFKQAFEREGKSVCKGRWVAIRHGNRIAYAQWEDCGPFRTDHWQYVFGNDRPKPNLNQGAGLDVSPAVRDYLGLTGKDICDWKFVEFRDVPNGPWAKYGDNNTFVLQRRGSDLFLTDRNNAYNANGGNRPR